MHAASNVSQHTRQVPTGTKNNCHTHNHAATHSHTQHTHATHQHRELGIVQHQHRRLARRVHASVHNVNVRQCCSPGLNAAMDSDGHVRTQTTRGQREHTQVTYSAKKPETEPVTLVSEIDMAARWMAMS